MSFIKTKDGTDIYYKDWGEGPVVVFSHGWPLSSDAWDGQMLFLAQHGFRAVAHDRRGHGRSSQASSGNDMDGYADDLAAVIEALDLKNVALVGHSTGGAEVAHYIGRHSTARVDKAVLISAAVPALLQSEANPEGLPMAAFDGIIAGLMADRSQFYRDLSVQFYSANSPGAKVSQGVLDQFSAWSMQSGLRNSCASVMSLLRRFHRGPRSVRYADLDPPRGGRSGHPGSDLSGEGRGDHQGREGHPVSGRATRHHGHPPGRDQRRVAQVPWRASRRAPMNGNASESDGGDAGANVRIAILSSHHGGHLQTLLEDPLVGHLVVLVIADRPDAYALRHAEWHGISGVALRTGKSNLDLFDRALVQLLEEHAIDYVVVAGFPKVVGTETARSYPGRIAKVHHSLLPSSRTRPGR